MRTTLRSFLLYVAICAVTLFVVSCADENSATPSGGDDGNGEPTGTESVVVASLTVERGRQGAVIPVKITNDIDLRGVVMPLIIRQVDAGAFITSLKLTFGERLPADGLLKDIQFTNQYLNQDGTCKDGKPGGFGTIASYDTTAHDVPGSPVGILFSRQRLLGDDLPAGADATGSFLMTVNATSTAGRFEVDTTCVNPSNHLLFVKSNATGLVPSFTKGTITIQ